MNATLIKAFMSKFLFIRDHLECKILTDLS